MEDIFNTLANITRPEFFYQTTPMTPEELYNATQKATKQNDRVMLIYKAKNRPMSPSQVLDVYNAWFGYGLIWSIRRAINTLAATKDRKGNPIIPKLSHTGTLRPGPFGTKEGVWQLSE
jgi:hypothetical protein